MDNTKIKKKKIRAKRGPYVFAAVLVLIIAAAVEWLTIFELQNYENSFLQIYGDEQDGYVQVTIDQIKRLGPLASEDDITDIISSIDTSSDRYWTLSGGDNILFVKSVTETSRYKNLTAQSYYSIDSSQSFIDSLSVDRVKHDIIFIGEDRYIASGAKFDWNGQEYTICLMTYDYAILDQNALLEAKNTIIVIVTIIVAVFICVIMINLIKLHRNKTVILRLEDEKVNMNITINHLHELLLRYESYTAKYHTYYERVLPVFLNSLYEKKVEPLRAALFEAKDEEAEEIFLDNMILTMDESVLRFKLNNGKILIIFIGTDEKVGLQLIKTLDCNKAAIVKSENWQLDGESYLEKYNRFIGR